MTHTVSYSEISTVPTSPCVEWKGPQTRDGYGLISRTTDGIRRRRLAHRVRWEETNGPVPIGYSLHHRCLNKLCIRIDHLLLLTQSQHSAWANLHKTHCPRHHAYADHAWIDKRGWRQCRLCWTIRRQERKAA